MPQASPQKEKQSNEGKLNTSTIPPLNKGNLDEQMKQSLRKDKR
jgi:hypothetical protein